MWLWYDLEKSVYKRRCDICSFLQFYLMKVLIGRDTICWKPHLNLTSGSKGMSNWRILKTIENKRTSLLFVAISHNQCSWLSTDSARSYHIYWNGTCILIVLEHQNPENNFVRKKYLKLMTYRAFDQRRQLHCKDASKFWSIHEAQDVTLPEALGDRHIWKSIPVVMLKFIVKS